MCLSDIFTLYVQGMATEHVRAAIQLEQWLMEGAYNKVSRDSSRGSGKLKE